MSPLAELDHRRAGSGEPLVAIHGIGSSWRVFAPVLSALEERHEVLAPSLPGYGDSPPPEFEPTVPALVDSVERAMDDAGFATAHLVGNSMGGWIAAELAARGRARTVVAISPAGMFTRKELHYATRALTATYEAAQRAAPHAERITATAAGRRLAFSLVYARPERLTPEEAAYALRAMAGSRSFPRTLAWIAEGHMPVGLERIDCPFRVIWGTRDLLLPRRQGPRWTRYVRGAELVELPRLGHVPMGDDPPKTAAAVLEVTAGGVGAGVARGA
jgi:pimeloyl-ACP methyl ester carboxylesterase